MSSWNILLYVHLLIFVKKLQYECRNNVKDLKTTNISTKFAYLINQQCLSVELLSSHELSVWSVVLSTNFCFTCSRHCYKLLSGKLKHSERLQDVGENARNRNYGYVRHFSDLSLLDLCLQGIRSLSNFRQTQYHPNLGETHFAKSLMPPSSLRKLKFIKTTLLWELLLDWI